MDFIVLDNFITKYDETGRALLFISFDSNLIYWDISLPKKYKDMYSKQIEGLYTELLDQPWENSIDEGRRHSFFREHASNLLDLIVLTIPKMTEARIPDCFLLEDGNLDLLFLKKISEGMDFEPVKNVPYSYQSSKEFDFAYGIKMIIMSRDKYFLDNDVEIEEIDQRQFESFLTSFPLKEQWSIVREKCEQFYQMQDEEDRLLIAFNNCNEPIFFFVLDNSLL